MIFVQVDLLLEVIIFVKLHCLGSFINKASRVALFLTTLALGDLGCTGQWRCISLHTIGGYSDNGSFIHGVNYTPFAIS